MSSEKCKLKQWDNHHTSKIQNTENTNAVRVVEQQELSLLVGRQNGAATFGIQFDSFLQN